MTLRGWLTFLSAWLVLALVLTFVLYNMQGVSLDLVGGGSLDAPLGVVVIVAFALGAVSDAMLRVLRPRGKS